MSSPTVSDDGKWIWNGHEWLPIPSFDEFQMLQNSVPALTELSNQPISNEPTTVTIPPQNLANTDLPVFPLDFSPRIGSAPLDLGKVEDNAQEQDSVYTNNKLDLFVGDVIEVFVGSFATTFSCCLIIFISMFAYIEFTADSSVAVTTLTITDSNGLRVDSVFEFFPEKTEISAQACYAIWCPTDRVVEKQEPIPSLFCGSRTDVVDGYDCSDVMDRSTDLKSSILVVALVSFPLFFFGNYYSSLQSKPREVSIRQVGSIWVGIYVILIAFRNLVSHVSHISDILLTAGVSLNPDKYVEVQTLPNIIPEVIMIVLCYAVFTSRDESVHTQDEAKD